jgi:cell division protein ZapA
MRLVASQGKTVDSLRVAVLAALNIADELARAEEKLNELSGNLTETRSSIHKRASSLNGLLDSLLTEDRRIG